ncbi:MAG: AAA family ATPase [Desulfobacterales bacterium]|nr:AAA family ATPase [Desulfobacterales bacterium]
MYARKHFKVLESRFFESRRFIQVLWGPRQTGKTTLAHQVAQSIDFPCHYSSADEPALKDRTWLEQQWEAARAMIPAEAERKSVLLIVDEVQKIQGWSETVKRLWDEDTASRLPLQVLLLGSSSLLMQQGLTESLAGRFETIPVSHWTFSEMQEAFGWDLDAYIYYGGYPGAAFLVADRQRWGNYIKDALIETTISRDILLMTRVDKPALLRRLFHLACEYSGQVLSYQKMLGQLQDAGNTTTLAHYLDLLQSAGLVMGLQKYAGQKVRQRASSPKLLVLNTALMSALQPLSLPEAKQTPAYWGRLVETAVGSTLANQLKGSEFHLYYWLSRSREVDFVLARGDSRVAIEVKSSRRKTNLPGTEAFSKEFPTKRKLLVGAQGIPLERFLKTPPQEWM